MRFWPQAKSRSKSPLLFGCNQCGDCCREMQVPLNHQDLLRIYQAHPELPLSHWLLIRPVESEHPEAIWLSGSPGVLLLRQRQGGCFFLKEDQHCSLYALRPRVCRIWPLEYTPGEQTLRVAPQHEMLVKLACDQTPVSAETLAATRAEIEAIARDYRAYDLLIQRWNQRARTATSDHTLEDFVRFLAARS